MTTPTTFRAELATQLLAVLDAFKAANPTLLASTAKARLANVAAGDLPIAFIDARSEQGEHVAGLRTRTIQPSITVVWMPDDNIEAVNAQDIFVDAFVDFLTANPHIVAGSVWDQYIVTDHTETIGQSEFPAVTFTLGNVSRSEGRT